MTRTRFFFTVLPRHDSSLKTTDPFVITLVFESFVTFQTIISIKSSSTLTEETIHDRFGRPNSNHVSNSSFSSPKQRLSPIALHPASGSFMKYAEYLVRNSISAFMCCTNKRNVNGTQTRVQKNSILFNHTMYPLSSLPDIRRDRKENDDTPVACLSVFVYRYGVFTSARRKTSNDINEVFFRLRE